MNAARHHEPTNNLAVPTAVDWVLETGVVVAAAHAQRLATRRVRVQTLPNGGPSGSCRALMSAPRYLAPEQLVDPASADERSDVWALGVVLFELVAGVAPIPARSYLELRHLLLSSEPVPPLDLLAPHVPPAFARVVACALEKDRELRYPSLVELADALAPFGGELAAQSAGRIAALLGPPRSGVAAASPRRLRVDRRSRPE